MLRIGALRKVCLPIPHPAARIRPYFLPYVMLFGVKIEERVISGIQGIIVLVPEMLHALMGEVVPGTWCSSSTPGCVI